MPEPDVDAALRALDRRLEKVEDLFERIRESITKIEAAVFVMDRDSSLGVDAYNGLRKQVIASATERQAHLHQLAQFADAVDHQTPHDQLQQLVLEWMGQSDLIQVMLPSTAEDLEAFEIHGEPTGSFRISRPAFLDGKTKRVVQMGNGTWIHPDEAPADDVPTDDASPGGNEAPVDDLAEEQP